MVYMEYIEVSPLLEVCQSAVMSVTIWARGLYRRRRGICSGRRSLSAQSLTLCSWVSAPYPHPSAPLRSAATFPQGKAISAAAGLWADEGIGPYRVRHKIEETGGQSRPPLHSKSMARCKLEERADESIGPYMVLLFGICVCCGGDTIYII